MFFKRSNNRWMLVLFDLLFYIFTGIFILIIYPSSVDFLSTAGAVSYIVLGMVCIFIPRLVTGVYKKIWRYANASDYLWLVITDVIGGLLFLSARKLMPQRITFVRAVSIICLNLLGSICMRLGYQFIYENRNSSNILEKMALVLLRLFTGAKFSKDEAVPETRKIRIAIIGAGSVGAMLAEELLNNPKAVYKPICFVDVNKEKVGRTIAGVPILDGNEVDLENYDIQEVVFALPNVSTERRKQLYEIYTSQGYKIKIYDYPNIETSDGKRHLRDFAIEDLLYRSSVDIVDEKTASWYRGKFVMITGGGGSIGGELARQIAKVEPSRLVLLDNYENGVYDIQQELRTRYPELNLRVEIANICDKEVINRIFYHHTPDIVLHAAAHKHVPLMERNVMEAVKNNIFGTLNVVEACEKYGVKRFIMISTDKAVNPTNVMGATKRMCEMIVQSRSGMKTSFSATRFGNVLGSNGSVIPLFKRQIANGGPITLTDKRITRYFMTIPEASQLVMTSGAMAKNGELFVLDMGKPVKILELAEDMVRLSGLEPYKDIQIVEIGLRPGEKLYEELLIRTEELDKTENDKIFVERDKPLSMQKIQEKLDILRTALDTGSNTEVKKALMKVVPTYHTPEEVNERAVRALIAAEA